MPIEGWTSIDFGPMHGAAPEMDPTQMEQRTRGSGRFNPVADLGGHTRRVPRSLPTSDGRGLDALECPVWSWWQLRLDGIADLDGPTEHDDPHDSGPLDQGPVRIPVVDLLQQARLKRFDLPARIAEASHRYEGGLADSEYRTRR